MCPLRRVEGHRAGPSALGILVPPGRRTFLIVRPRSLAWDLLLVRPDAPATFLDLPRHEADRAAGELFQALGRWSDGASGHVEDVASPAGDGYWVRVRVGPFALLVCARRPGQPYQPLTFADREAAWAAAGAVRRVLRPPAGVEQEVYLNAHHFAR